MLKRVETFKSGPFIFSNTYNKQILSEMLITNRILFATISELPILPPFVAQLEKELVQLKAELIRKSIFGTAAIEGNPLSEQEVEAILTDSKRKEHFQRVEKEIENLKHVYNRIIGEVSHIPSKSFKLTENLIKDIHKFITIDIDYEGNVPGYYRNYPVKVGDKEHGGIYTPPKILADVEKLMAEFINWINSEEILQEDEAIRAALAHYYLGLIHPFADGNGRTARAVEAVLLKSAGIKFVPYMLSNYYYQHIDGYFWAFSLMERNKEGHLTDFLEFFLKGMVTSLQEIKSRVIWMIRKFMLKDYYDFLKEERFLRQRQYDLLTLLVSYSKESFSLNELFKEPMLRVIYRDISERTARRDLDKLQTKNLLKYNAGQYSLNWHILEQFGTVLEQNI